MKLMNLKEIITLQCNRVLLLVADLMYQLCLLIYKFTFIFVIDAIAKSDNCVYDG